jgi:hypothetical protein
MQSAIANTTPALAYVTTHKSTNASNLASGRGASIGFSWLPSIHQSKP